MITKELVDRINVLANKKKTEGLTEEEKAEQVILREKYLEGFRANFKNHLNKIKYVEDLTEEELAQVHRDNAQAAKERAELEAAAEEEKAEA